MTVPSRWDLLNPTLDALRQAGGSAYIGEIAKSVIERLDLTEDVTSQLHGTGPVTELEYQLYWARTELKKYGVIVDSSRGIWALTPTGQDTEIVDSVEVRQTNQATRAEEKKLKQISSADTDTQDAASEPPEDAEVVEAVAWQEELLQSLLNVPWEGFERLCQRMLREAGFIEVKVTRRTKDNGIDGHGILLLNELINLRVAFQCKRYRDRVSSSAVRDFRGAIQGRSERGLLITTGRFTDDAIAEATRDGAMPIDLMNGNQLVNKLKDLRLGVEIGEVVSVNVDWFNSI